MIEKAMANAEVALMSPATRGILPDSAVPAGCEILLRGDYPYGYVLFTTREELERMERPAPPEIPQRMDLLP